MTLSHGVRTRACSLEELSYEFRTIPYLSTTVLLKLDLNWIFFRSVLLLWNVAQLGENRLIRPACVISGRVKMTQGIMILEPRTESIYRGNSISYLTEWAPTSSSKDKSKVGWYVRDNNNEWKSTKQPHSREHPWRRNLGSPRSLVTPAETMRASRSKMLKTLLKRAVLRSVP